MSIPPESLFQRVRVDVCVQVIMVEYACRYTSDEHREVHSVKCHRQESHHRTGRARAWLLRNIVHPKQPSSSFSSTLLSRYFDVTSTLSGFHHCFLPICLATVFAKSSFISSCWKRQLGPLKTRGLREFLRCQFYRDATRRF